MRIRNLPASAYLLIAWFVAASVQTSLPAHADDSDPYVAFNTRSLIFHQLKCDFVRRCTANCVQVRRSEAISRGGRPCRYCRSGLQESRIDDPARRRQLVLQGDPRSDSSLWKNLGEEFSL
jgi:methylphosphotriester-DNA--protein-cysteine methyltransferase